MRGLKTGGRKPGSQNKNSAELKSWIAEVIDDNKRQFVENLAKVEPEKHIAIIEKLMSYIVAKPQNIEVTTEQRPVIQILDLHNENEADPPQPLPAPVRPIEAAPITPPPPPPAPIETDTPTPAPLPIEATRPERSAYRRTHI